MYNGWQKDCDASRIHQKIKKNSKEGAAKSQGQDERGIKKMTHRELRNKALKKTSVKKEYDRLEPEFTLLREMLRARNKAGLTQAQIAKRMGTKSPAITRLESSLSSGKHSPSLATIKKYLEVLDCRLEIKIIHN